MALRARVVLRHAWLACPGVQRSFRASFPVGDKTCTRGRQKCIFFGVMLPKMLHNRRCFIIDGQYPLLDTVSSVCRRCNARWDRDPRDCRAAARAGRKSLLEMRLVQLKGLHRSILRQIAPLTVRRGGRGRENPVEKATCATERLAQVDIPTDSGEATCTGRNYDRILPRRSAMGALRGKNLSETRLVQLKGLHRSEFRQVFAPGASHRPLFRRIGPHLSCTGRYSDRFRRRDLQRSIFRQTFAPGASHGAVFPQVPPQRLAQVDIPTDRLPPCRPTPRPVCASRPPSRPRAVSDSRNACSWRKSRSPHAFQPPRNRPATTRAPCGHARRMLAGTSHACKDFKT